VRKLPLRQSALVPAPFLVSGFAGSPGLGDRRAHARASRILLFSLFSEHCAAQRERGPWRLGESRQGKPSREWEGTQLGNFVLGQI
jgi:hypothetical protein